MPARTVRDGWGVCARPGGDGPVAETARMMASIGTSHLRCHLVQQRTSAAETLVALARAVQGSAARVAGRPSLQVTTLVTAYMNDRATRWADQQEHILGFARTGLLQAIEGPNEINNLGVGHGSHGPDDLELKIGPADYPGNFMAWAQVIDRFRRANASALSGVSVIAPCIASGRAADYARLPDVGKYVDASNFHFYAGGGRQPSFSMQPNPNVGSFASLFQWTRAAQAPNAPVWMTECGATTNGVGYARDGLSQAKYLGNQIFDFFAIGGQRMFIYHLQDVNSTPGDIEGNFGLFHHDGTPKPAARMLAGLKHILSLGRHNDPRNAADTGRLIPGYDTGMLTVTSPALSPGSPAGTAPRLLAMPKADGTTLLAVWNEPPIDDGGHDLTPDGVPVTIDLGTERSCRIYDLMDPELEAHALSAGSPARTRRVTMTLSGYPMMVAVGPG